MAREREEDEVGHVIMHASLHTFSCLLYFKYVRDSCIFFSLFRATLRALRAFLVISLAAGPYLATMSYFMTYFLLLSLATLSAVL